MPFPKQKFRELLLQLLYREDFMEGEEEAVTDLAMEQLKTSKKNVREALEYIKKVGEKKSFLDRKIQELSHAYEFDRISPVERNILRLGIFELFFAQDIPPKVIFAESVRLCRKFATAESARFVNALLDALYKKDEALAVR